MSQQDLKNDENNWNQDILSWLSWESLSSPKNTENSVNIWNENEVNVDMLSTILTDTSLYSESSKKESSSPQVDSSNGTQNKIIFDINVKDVDDLIGILLKEQYDFVAVEPQSEYVKVSFKKDSILKDVKYIRFPEYLNLILKAKKIAKLNIEETKQEQKWKWVYLFQNKNLDVLTKTTPGQFWETLFVKVQLSEEKIIKKAKVKKSISAGTAFWFLWAILFIALVLWWAFLTFVIFNAQTPEDVSFFANLWINLNDINSFLLKLTTFIFSIVIVLETILLVIFLFKAIFTKKELKRKRTGLFVVSTLLLILTVSTASLWMYLDKTIKGLPNWLELSYGMIQVYDNNLLNDESIWKAGALMSDYTSLIGPIDLKFDVTYLQREEQRSGFKISKFIWDFGDGKKIESQNPDIIHSFTQKWNYTVSLVLEWVDSRVPNKITTKPASEQITLSIPYLVKIDQKTLANGGRTLSFDASELKPLWDIEWYMKDNLNEPAYVGFLFQPSKIYFESDIIGMRIKNSQSNYMDRIFTIEWETSEIKGKIDYEVSYNNDLEYTFRVNDIENTFWDGFVEKFTWVIDGKETTLPADILHLDDSSEITYKFPAYGMYDVKVILENSSGNSTQLSAQITTVKKIKLTNNIDFYINQSKLEDIKFDEKTLEYFIYDLWAPTIMSFDAKNVRADNPLYALKSIKWDVGWDGNFEGEWKQFEHEFNFAGFDEVLVEYTFVHRRNEEDIVTFNHRVNLEFIMKEAILDLKVNSDSEYVPAIVSFDASLSKVQDDNIVKFIYDYWDGIIEERDALNPWHRYLKEWEYTIKLKVVTEKWKEYTLTKSLVLKPFDSKTEVKVSMKEAPVGQEIDFLSTGSMWQIVAYHWDFGDGEYSTEANPSHAYKEAGNYKVVLTIDFANNNIMTDNVEITITE